MEALDRNIKTCIEEASKYRDNKAWLFFLGSQISDFKFELLFNRSVTIYAENNRDLHINELPSEAWNPIKQQTISGSPGAQEERNITPSVDLPTSNVNTSDVDQDSLQNNEREKSFSLNDQVETPLILTKQER